MVRNAVIGVVLLIVAVAMILLTRQRGDEDRPTEPPPSAKREARPSPAPRQSPVELSREQALARWDLPKPPASAYDRASTEHQAWIKERVTELRDQSWFFDEPEILRKVMTELRSPEPELRAAALEAVINLGSRDAIPYLESAAALTEQAGERKALIDAAEYLSLPTVFEAGGLPGN